eukprot:763576-Hanusia_phi.AAC.6
MSKVDSRPDPVDIFRGMMQNSPSPMMANHPFFSRMGGLFPSRGRNPDERSGSEPFNPFSRIQKRRGDEDDDDDEHDDDMRPSRISLPFQTGRSPFRDRSTPMFPAFPGRLRTPFQVVPALSVYFRPPDSCSRMTMTTENMPELTEPDQCGCQDPGGNFELVPWQPHPSEPTR